MTDFAIKIHQFLFDVFLGYLAKHKSVSKTAAECRIGAGGTH